jgi:hypothetical protein
MRHTEQGEIMSIDLQVKNLRQLLEQEQALERINSLDTLAESTCRRGVIQHTWQTIQAELQPLQKEIGSLPDLPDRDQIAWAQALLTMPNLAFMEIDTTGLNEEDEIIRFTLVTASEQVLEDIFIKPTTAQVTMEASRINGITTEQLLQNGLDSEEAWARIQSAIMGRYIVSFNQRWDLEQLSRTATRHHLKPIVVIGEDLRAHCTKYYNREYYLTLTGLCERVGRPLPDYPEQTAVDRAKGQVFLTWAMAQAITDVRPPKPQELEVPTTDQDDTEDEHPF